MNEYQRQRALSLLLELALGGNKWAEYWYNYINAAKDKDAAWAEFWTDYNARVEDIKQAAKEIATWAEQAGASFVTAWQQGMEKVSK